jgi:hypothetical protein
VKSLGRRIASSRPSSPRGRLPEAFGFYPTDHEGSGEVVKLSGRNLVFGDVNDGEDV